MKEYTKPELNYCGQFLVNLNSKNITLIPSERYYIDEKIKDDIWLNIRENLIREGLIKNGSI